MGAWVTATVFSETSRTRPSQDSLKVENTKWGHFGGPKSASTINETMPFQKYFFLYPEQIINCYKNVMIAVIVAKVTAGLIRAVQNSVAAGLGENKLSASEARQFSHTCENVSWSVLKIRLAYSALKKIPKVHTTKFHHLVANILGNIVEGGGEYSQHSWKKLLYFSGICLRKGTTWWWYNGG